MSIIPKWSSICWLDQNPTKIPMAFFSQKWENWPSNPYGIAKVPKYWKKILTEKNNVGGITLPDFQAYYKGTVIKTV
jgi:hypothetical protein